MMPSLHFGLRSISEETNLMNKCLFCRDRNLLCSSKWVDRGRQTEIVNLNLENIPESLLLHIFLFLNLRDLMVVRKVSKLWKRIAEDRQLWKTINLSCKRITESLCVFAMPKMVTSNIRVLNTMWSTFTFQSFYNTIKTFPCVEVLLLKHCKFSNAKIKNEGRINMQQKSQKSNIKNNDKKTYLKRLKILDLRHIQERWFDECEFHFNFLSLEAIALSQTLPNNWLNTFCESWLPNLKILHIQNNTNITEVFMEKLIVMSPLLEAIHVQGCMYINGGFLSNATERLTHLKHLNLNSTRLEGANFSRAKWENVKLNSLNISFCCKIQSNDLINILSKSPALKHLQVSFVGWGKSLNDDVIFYTTRYHVIPNLESLDLQSTFTMSANALTTLCRECTRLRHLRIGNVLKTESELRIFLDSIPNIEELSVQIGGSSFTAVQLFDLIAVKCMKLRSIFLYNILFDVTPSTTIQTSIEKLFDSLKQLQNFFMGGYPYREKNRIESLIAAAAKTLKLNINFKRPKRIIPHHEGCFDEYVANLISIPYYHAVDLRGALQKTHDCHSFYQTGLQKLGSFEFPMNS